jgi:hypothetical protein
MEPLDEKGPVKDGLRSEQILGATVPGTRYHPYVPSTIFLSDIT